MKKAYKVNHINIPMIEDWKTKDRGVFLVRVLGIVYDPKKKQILIGRTENDPFIPKLSWQFPGGRPAYEQDLEFYLKLEIKKKTGLDVVVKKIVFARTYEVKREFLSIFYHCEPSGKAKAGEKFVELKWIKPTDVKKYFYPPVHPEVLKYLKTLE